MASALNQTKQMTKQHLSQQLNNDRFVVEQVTEHFVKRLNDRGIALEDALETIVKSFRRNEKLIYNRFGDVSTVDINVFSLHTECVLRLRKGTRCATDPNGEKMLIAFITAYPFSRPRLNKQKNNNTCFA